MAKISINTLFQGTEHLHVIWQGCKIFFGVTFKGGVHELPYEFFLVIDALES